MVHLLVLGLLALLSSGLVGCVDFEYLLLFYGFSRSRHGESVVSVVTIDDSRPVFTDDSPALSQCSDEAEAGSCPTKKTKRSSTATPAGKAEAR